MFKLKNNSRRGSTIIEVLIATTLVGFALTGLAMLMTTNVKNSAEADYREAAAGIAQDTMEKIRQRKTTVAWEGVGNFKADPYPSTTTGCGTTLEKYKTDFLILCTKSALPTNDITITVQICWPQATGASCAATSKSTQVVQRFYNY